MITLVFPRGFEAEFSWIGRVLLNELIGIEERIFIRAGDFNEVRIECAGKYISLPSIFFGQFYSDALDSFVIPRQKLDVWRLHKLSESYTPIIFGENKFHIEDSCSHVGIDIFGSAFFMLSQYEEVVSTMRDNHGRFLAKFSWAYKSNFIHRPIIDEYAEILWRCMQQLWPALNRKVKEGKVEISCDVDHPYDCNSKSFLKSIRQSGADVFKNKSLVLASNRLVNVLFTKFDSYRFDPYNTFSWYMNACEEENLRATFYFIAGHSGGNIDGCYTLNESYVKKLLKNIVERGHNIGLHASYNTYRDAGLLASEKEELQKACESAGLSVNVTHSRQHYLRWDSISTPDVLEKAGISTDSSGGFADMPGFRFGTCKAFSMWSWRKKAALKLMQYPLVMMEGSVISNRYLGLGCSEAAYTLVSQLKAESLRWGGEFNLLWHNSFLYKDEYKELFLKAIATTTT